jgi:hypothetical protein
MLDVTCNAGWTPLHYAVRPLCLFLWLGECELPTSCTTC